MFTPAFTSIEEHLNFDLVVCDEGHRLKNAGVKASQYLASMSTDKRIVLTGTPLQNELKEFLSNSKLSFVNLQKNCQIPFT